MNPTPAQSANRFVIDKVELSHESEGPDYYSAGEYQVTDTATGEIVARFLWSLEEAYLTNASYSGPEDVRISDDGTEAIARQGDVETRVLLPAPWRRIEVDGVEITPETDYVDLARRVACDDGPEHPVTRFREAGGQWLWKLFDRLGRTPASAALAQAVSSMLDSPTSRERAAALRFYYYRPDAPGSDRLLDLAESARPLFTASEPGSWGDRSTLDGDLTITLAQGLRHAGADARRVSLARAEALRPGAREPLLIALAERDPAWVNEHALDLARADEGRWKDLLYGVYLGAMDDLGAIAARLVHAGVMTRRDALKYARSRFRGYGLGLVENSLATS